MQNNRVEFSVSKQFTILTSILLLATLIIVCLLPCMLLIKILLTCAVVGYGYYILFQFVLLLDDRSIMAVTRQDDGWLLHERNSTLVAQLCGSSTVTTYICILRFIIAGKRRKRVCIVFRDSLEHPGAFRKFFTHLLRSHS